MPTVVSTQTTECESEVTRPEFVDEKVETEDWHKNINYNFGVVGKGNRPMRWPFRTGEDETTIGTIFLPKQFNSTLILINDTIDGLSIYVQSEDSAGVWVKKT